MNDLSPEDAPDNQNDDDLSVTRDPTPQPPGPAPPLPPMSDADDTVDTQASDPNPPRSHGSPPELSPELPPPPDDAPVVPGYHLLHKLGEGGMGVVWKALQRATRREVALKLLSPAAFGSDTARLRFQREVELAARLEHPFIARVYDSSPAPAPGISNPTAADPSVSGGGSAGVIYYAMELVPGTDLETHVRMHGLAPKAILQLMRDVCLGVQHAHQRGVIHRDLKPSNILVLESGLNREDAKDAKTKSQTKHTKNTSANASGLSKSTSTLTQKAIPKIVDFGLAKTLTPEDGQVTLSHAGQIAGTPAYMSPEQAAGRTDAIDTRTDVYALGVILYRLLTGKYPHDTNVSFANLLRHITEDEVVRPRAASEDASKLIDRELETLLLKALDKDPDRRYDNAGALAADLDNYLNDNPLSARPASVSYLIRKRISKHRVAASVAAAIIVVSIGGTYAGYRMPGELKLQTNPSQASIVLNDIPKPECGRTPCKLTLPAGTHKVTLVYQGPYEPYTFLVDVKFGRAVPRKTDGVIALIPDFQTVSFTSEPTGANVRLQPIDTSFGREALNFKTPVTQDVPAGDYHMFYELTGYQDPEPGGLLEIEQSSNSFKVHRQLNKVVND